MKLIGFVQVGTGENYFKLSANFAAGWKHREQAGRRQLGKQRALAKQYRQQKKE